ncbi:AAA family ATPase [Clostridium luticellarii]|uniref:ATP-dependent zinc metalloprotease FtsH n=1 Tax=Clostridium luticellarii TaxID=1691940 RepID=A0A2T0BMG7_9CLOT|nr:AAA family ATPase [Clostridium luticellarii]MCI1945273.1 AAA family ATPase [Clostridium luticellarii]MCI1969013.1 AAA family ATPase [Clostridium luticellarii]MCI1994606.1 AAA family ATPase [Clostridium luticellarii]MCI2038897.1 AAA family ATPase [Clostridium luticellarii]PRR85075.1 ATP-dependent zinc metalloprotease FtsH [Clostridium luticellarii]
MAEFNSIKLKVKEGLIEDSRKGIVRINREDMEKLGADTGDVVGIKGSKVTAAKVYPSFSDIYGSPLIQMDGVIRHNAGVGIDGEVEVSKAAVKTAQKVVLSPMENSCEWTREDEDEVKSTLRGIPLICEDELSLTLFGNDRHDFLVSGTAPSGIVKVSRETDIVFVQPELVTAGSRITYEDIGGLDEQLQKIREIVELPLKYPDVFKKLGIEPPKGILLHGPPGTGKTLIARAVASETKAYFIHVNGPEIMNKFYGESEAKLRGVFKEAKSRVPSIIFLDELDSIAPRRENVHGEVEKRVVAQLLALMDGLESRGQVVVIGATNIPDSLDPALRRAGRFDREIAIMPPNKEGRLRILRIHTRCMPLDKDVKLDELAKITYGFVGSDLAALCKETGMTALRKILPKITEKNVIPSFKVSMDDFKNSLREIQPSSTREYYSEIPDVRWDDIGGLKKTKKVLQALVELPLHHPDLCQIYRFVPPKGILITGPSGTGKTMLANAAGNSARTNFIVINGLTLASHWKGEAERVLHDIFVKAKQTSPCILFFDELDGIVRFRTSGASNLKNGLISQLILEFDALEKIQGVTVLAATSRIDLIDSVLLREGRFEYILDLPLPTAAERESIFKIHSRGLPIDDEDVDFKKLAEKTGGMSGAQLAGICHRASFIAIMLSIKNGLKIKIDQNIFNQSIDEINNQKKLEGVIKTKFQH